jgi:hypothetical protein
VRNHRGLYTASIVSLQYGFRWSVSCRTFSRHPPDNLRWRSKRCRIPFILVTSPRTLRPVLRTLLTLLRNTTVCRQRLCFVMGTRGLIAGEKKNNGIYNEVNTGSSNDHRSTQRQNEWKRRSYQGVPVPTSPNETAHSNCFEKVEH